MYKFNHKNLLLVALLGTLFTNLNVNALEQRTAPEALIKSVTYLDGGATPDGQRIVLMQVEKSEYADKIEISDNNPILYNFPESWKIKGNMYSVLLSPQAKTITIKAIGKRENQLIQGYTKTVWKKVNNWFWSWDWHGWFSWMQPIWKKIDVWIDARYKPYKYKDQLVELSLAEHMTQMDDISLSVSREGDAEQLVIASQFEPLTNAKSYQQVCTSDDGYTISASTTDFDANSLTDHYGRSYRCTVNVQ